ncbi:hypothetical protein A1Q2_04664 [Trichosporon asahii var. asahii CBS 8904]|uniref:Uncharacterized protein n=1 Tax=Trichosporon asahii var. asahii (strain CBS 8904) TaxID=1220162 RepID=K1VW07_TRIAC|nr:hypothetical protein A1Q2_04664 [Trichosporon asahii var. asahii CBS 8904]
MPRSLSDQLRLATLLGLALTLGAAAHEGHVHGTTSAAAAAATGHDMSGMDMGDGSMDMGGDEHMGAMTGMKMWVHGTIGDDSADDVLEVLLPSVRPCRSPLPDLHMDMAKM